LVRLLEKYVARYRVTMLAYCLMPNHYHLVVRQEEGGSVSRFLRTTFNAFTQTVNVMTGHSGTLFQGEAKGILVDTDWYALNVICYVHLNPVRARLVRNCADWEFSNYREWIGRREGPLVDLNFRDEHFGGPANYRRYVEGYQKTVEANVREFLQGPKT
ncbi:MAG: transposase, partial [Bacteroidota bacterium]